jgi:hypothetical protein
MRIFINTLSFFVHIYLFSISKKFWLLSADNEFRRDEYCWDTPDGVQVKIYGCHGGKGHQEFFYRSVSERKRTRMVAFKLNHSETNI